MSQRQYGGGSGDGGGGYKQGGQDHRQGGRGRGRGRGFSGGNSNTQSQGGGGRGESGGANKWPDPPFFKDQTKFLDPYKQQQQKPVPYGWKPYIVKNVDEVELQKRPEAPATWALKKINVSVNHYLIESTKSRKTFPFPVLYHYDIGYEMIREKKDEGPAPGPSKPPEPSGSEGGKKKGGGGKKRKHKQDVEQLTKTMRDTGMGDGGGDGGSGGGDGGSGGGDGGSGGGDGGSGGGDGGSGGGDGGSGGGDGGSGGGDGGGGSGPSPRPKPEAKKLPKHLTKAILDYLIPQVRIACNHQAIATDGSFNMYSTRELKNEELQHEVTFSALRKVKVIDDDNNSGTILVTFQPTIDKTTGEIHTIDTTAIALAFKKTGNLRGFELSSEVKQTLEAACNAFVRSMPNYPYFSVGRSTMVPCIGAKYQALGGGLMVWKGISANIVMGWKPYLNVDIANCAMILNDKVLQVLKEAGIGNPEDINKWRSGDWDKANDLLKTCKISYMVDGQKRSGPITNIPRNKSPSTHKFRWEEKKKEISVFDYYKERYGMTLAHPNGPLLEIRRKAMVPAELCTIKQGQSYNRRLDGDQTTEMIRFARKKPHELKGDIDLRISEMDLGNNKVLQGLEVKVDSKMLNMEARVLVAPVLRYGHSQRNPEQIDHASPKDGIWEIWRGIKDDFNFYNPVKVNKWGILSVGCGGHRGVTRQMLDAFAKALARNGSKKGMQFSPDPIIHLDTTDRRSTSAKENAKDLVDIFKKIFKGCEIVVVVFPRKGDPLYGHIKHAAEVEAGMLTQCVASKHVTMERVNDSTCQNILLKMNTKLRGINHVTVPPFDAKLASMFCKVLMNCPVLVLGADVTHAPPGSKKTVNGKDLIMPSYAAVTGSLDKTCMPYMTEVRAQRKAGAGAAEVIQDLEEIVASMILKFYDTSKVIPRKIVYFRDGVGEGQFPEVLHVEMNAIRIGCVKAATEQKARNPEGYQPKITFITVQKRHKTRIFWESQNGQIQNAPPGTVIDSEIVHPTETDFYLLSHFGMMGTSRPSRYHVLWDDSDFSLDEIQSLAYILCHQYARCTRSVKMPAPTYYAHLAADRAKKLCEGFEGKNDQELSDKNLNAMLRRHDELTKSYPMHFI